MKLGRNGKPLRETTIVRVDPLFRQEFENTMKIRLNNNLARLRRGELSMPEYTKLLLKTPSWQKVRLEMQTLPKKENLTKL